MYNNEMQVRREFLPPLKCIVDGCQHPKTKVVLTRGYNLCSICASTGHELCLNCHEMIQGLRHCGFFCDDHLFLFVQAHESHLEEFIRWMSKLEVDALSFEIVLDTISKDMPD